MDMYVCYGGCGRGGGRGCGSGCACCMVAQAVAAYPAQEASPLACQQASSLAIMSEAGEAD